MKILGIVLRGSSIDDSATVTCRHLDGVFYRMVSLPVRVADSGGTYHVPLVSKVERNIKAT